MYVRQVSRCCSLIRFAVPLVFLAALGPRAFSAAASTQEQVAAAQDQDKDKKEEKKDENKKDEKKGLPLKPERKIQFTTDEGTWLSLDVSPDGKIIVFELLGDFYSLPIEAGHATLISGGISFDSQPKFSPVYRVDPSRQRRNCWSTGLRLIKDTLAHAREKATFPDLKPSVLLS